MAALLTSVMQGPATEAFAMPELDTFTTPSSQTAVFPEPLSLSVVVTIDVPDAAPPQPFIGPEPVQRPEVVLQGNRLLQQLALLSPTDLTQFTSQNPHAIANLLANPPAASDVGLWWSSMDVSARTTLRTTTPELVGNLEGVPYAIRDLANRTLLQSTMASLQEVIATDDGRTVVDNARNQLDMLQSISNALATPQGEIRRTLLSLDVEGQGRASIVLGDLRTADYVSYLVPGMFFTIQNQMGDWVSAATTLHNEELAWLARLGETHSTVATVAWIGYHTPNLTNVGGIDNAYEGRDSLAGAIQGLQAIRSGNEPYISVIAHSYGSTAALLALTDYSFQIDGLALVGSPGSPAKSALQLHVRGGNVFVGEAAWDPIPNSAYFGSDPGSPSYGAHTMGVSGGLDPITGEKLLGSNGHNEYFSPGTESMRNFALIAIGRDDLVLN